jgi:ABC-type molybdate transport system substrate-binding protein
LSRPLRQGGGFDFFMSFAFKVLLGLAVLSSASLVTQAEPTNPSDAAQLTITAPAELKPAITQLARAFEQKSSKPLQVTVEPGENRRSPIKKAPDFDALFSPDVTELQRLMRLNLESKALIARSITSA